LPLPFLLLQRELNCTYQGVPIDCIFTMNASRFATADGMYFHTPGSPQVSKGDLTKLIG
jgi:hypothetical protein